MKVSEMSKKTRTEKRGVGKNRKNNGVKNTPDRREGQMRKSKSVRSSDLQGNTLGASERPASPFSDPPGDGVMEIGCSVDRVEDSVPVE